MDKGTQAFTSYEFDGDVADFLMNKVMEDPQNFSTLKVGHIHSHNSMGVFFSGTDWDELYDNCHNHNFYLSLIVNNYMEMIAKLVFRAEPVRYSALDENGEPYSMEVTQNEDKQKMLFVYDCDIESSLKAPEVDQAFQDRLKFILDKPAKVTSYPTNYGTHSTQFIKSTTPSLDLKKTIEEQNQEKEFAAQFATEDEHFKDFEHDAIYNKMLEAFACYILRHGNIVKDDTMEKALDSAKITVNTSNATLYANKIIDNYPNYYDRFFKSDENVKMEDYLETIEDVFSIMDEYEGPYQFLTNVIKGLQNMHQKMSEQWSSVTKKQMEQLTEVKPKTN